MQIIPVWGRVVVKPHEIEETDEVLKSAKAAGIEIVNHERKREQFAQVEGDVVAVGGNAFEDWKGETPVVGDRVIYDKYAGFERVEDGVTYRVINDTDVIARLK